MKTLTLIGGVVGGIFVGAVLVEVLSGRKPQRLLTGLKQRACGALNAISEGFHEGYVDGKPAPAVTDGKSS